MGTIGALVSYVLWFNGLARLPALAASFLSFASPLCATVLGYFFLDQTLRPLQFVGAAAVIGAVVLAQRRVKAAPEEAPVPGHRACRYLSTTSFHYRGQHHMSTCTPIAGMFFRGLSASLIPMWSER